jgi:hypothetical protein
MGRTHKHRESSSQEPKKGIVLSLTPQVNPHYKWQLRQRQRQQRVVATLIILAVACGALAVLTADWLVR